MVGSVFIAPSPCMFKTSDGGGECLVQDDVSGYTFSFLGGQPGWPEDGSNPTTETELQVAPDGRSVTSIIYNGSPRPRCQPEKIGQCLFPVLGKRPTPRLVKLKSDGFLGVSRFVDKHRNQTILTLKNSST